MFQGRLSLNGFVVGKGWQPKIIAMIVFCVSNMLNHMAICFLVAAILLLFRQSYSKGIKLGGNLGSGVWNWIGLDLSLTMSHSMVLFINFP